MAAYAALLSLMHIVDNLRLHHRPPISLHIKQVESLTQKVSFLEEFLEIYNPHLPYSTEADPLESRIVDAAYAAEDIIESHIVDEIKNDGEKVSSDSLYEALEKVIEDMASIQEEAMEIKQAMSVQQQLHTNSVRYSSNIAQKSSMVGADDVLLEMKDKLTSNRLQLQIIPVIGMGGTGKTTLALNIYEDLLIKEHFHIRAWATISQEYDFPKMLIQVLRQLNLNAGQDLNEDELGEMLYKYLFGRKYLIVMDDMWSIEAWDGVRRFLPDNKNGSRVVVTTRLSDLASKLPNSDSLDMRLLDEAHSWDLLSKTVFGDEGCPLELEEIGKKIGKSCKGLPLSIVVVGGFLAKSKHTKEFWEYIEENLNSIVNLDDDERCLKILYMSYKQLPVHLKPCFLYVGVFPEDEQIRVSKLIKLWVAEGFLEPVSGRSLEDIARVYLKDLIGRNLMLIHKLGSTGNMKYCKIHDLLRDLCVREAEKQRFYIATSSPKGIINGQRRIVISNNEDINTLLSMPLARSVIWNVGKSVPQLNLRLVRILHSSRVGSLVREGFLELEYQFVNSRFLRLSTSEYPCPIRLFWNLQTLTSYHYISTMPTDIWYMPHIRHVRLLGGFVLPDPPNCQDDIVLENLQTLKFMKNLKCSQQVVKRIPDIKKLGLYYDEEILDDDDKYCLSNLDCLKKLESLNYCFYVEMHQIYFPHSLKKLSLWINNETQCWEDILDKIGVLPLLQKLKLLDGSFRDEEWVTTEGHFPSLKFLHLRECKDLRVWTTESSHLPCLEHLLLESMPTLVEIPLDIAEIPALRVIDVQWCCDSAVTSAKRILEEQEELYGGEATLQVRVTLSSKNAEALDSYASPNFRVTRFQI